jgi:hypothetical protein
LAGSLLAAVLLALPVTASAKRPLSETILDDKYRRGDYAFYLSWHDPWDAQFNEHARFAWPVGGKVRFRVGGPLRVEADFSYYQRGSQTFSFVSTFAQPSFDGLMVGAAAHYVPRATGTLRPYVGGGPIMVSLGNQFVAEIRGVGAVVLDRFVLGSWSELDIGMQTMVGLDIFMGGRASPFVEYRHLFGRLSTPDISVGFLTLDPEDLLYLDGAPVSADYDWSGPNVLAGLRIRF